MFRQSLAIKGFWKPAGPDEYQEDFQVSYQTCIKLIQSKLWENFLDTRRKSCSCHAPIFPLACPTLWANPGSYWPQWGNVPCPPLHGVANHSFPTPQLSKLRIFLTCFPYYCFCTPCCTSCTTITRLPHSFPLQHMHGDPYLYSLPSPYSPIF